MTDFDDFDADPDFVRVDHSDELRLAGEYRLFRRELAIAVELASLDLLDELDDLVAVTVGL